MRTPTRLLAVACAAGLLVLGGCDGDTAGGSSASSVPSGVPSSAPTTGRWADADDLRSDVRAVADAIEKFHAEHGTYPRHVGVHGITGEATLGRGVTVPLTRGVWISGASGASGTTYCLAGTAPGVQKVEYFDSSAGGFTTKQCRYW